MTLEQAKEILVEIAEIALDETRKTLQEWAQNTVNVMTADWFLGLIAAPGAAMAVFADRFDTLIIALRSIQTNTLQRALAQVAASIAFTEFKTRAIRADRAGEWMMQTLLVDGPGLVMQQRGLLHRLFLRWESGVKLWKLVTSPTLVKIFTYALRKALGGSLTRIFINFALACWTVFQTGMLLFCGILAALMLDRIAGGELEAMCFGQSAPRKRVESEDGPIIRREPGGSKP